MTNKNGKSSNGHKPKRKPSASASCLLNKRGKPFEQGNKLGRRWKSGESGNPQGRPKKRTLSEELRARLEEEYPDRPDATYGRMVAEALVDMAIKNGGAIAAISEIFDRIEGRPRQSVELKSDPEKTALIERAISALMERQDMSRDEAVEYLSTLKPEIGQWVN